MCRTRATGPQHRVRWQACSVYRAGEVARVGGRPKVDGTGRVLSAAEKGEIPSPDVVVRIAPIRQTHAETTCCNGGHTMRASFQHRHQGVLWHRHLLGFGSRPVAIRAGCPAWCRAIALIGIDLRCPVGRVTVCLGADLPKGRVWGTIAKRGDMLPTGSLRVRSGKGASSGREAL